jgi:hypothetical protein
MISTIRTFAFCVCFIALSSQAFVAQEAFRYREFQLGSDLASVAKQAGLAPSGAKVIHARPAVIQNLEWRPRYRTSGAAPVTDPVDMMLFRFYDDQLFTIVVDYDRRRTEGMSPADMIAAISATYGPVSQVQSRHIGPTPTVKYGIPDAPIAVWGDHEHSITLFRVSYPESFRLVVALTRLETLARTASGTAVQQDSDEAPQREIDRKQKEASDVAAALEKAKSENKAQFKP